MTGTQNLTDRRALLAHRMRAAHRAPSFLHQEAAEELRERLIEVKRTFTDPAIVGHATPEIRALFPDAPVFEDADRLALQPRSHDLIIHAFGLHWSEDPVGQMVQSRLGLTPDGLFLGVLFGGATLNELRTSLAEAETRLTGGLSPRVLPMADIRELGGLVSRAGLALPVADTIKLRVRYPSLARLVGDLRDMGETNALAGRRRNTASRALFDAVEDVYRAHFSDNEGYLLTTFEMVILTGWSPSDSQPKPLRPGSATQRLADALGVDEYKTGDPVAPKLR